jgi:Bacterial Ig domain
MTAGYEEDFTRWERGEISFDELVERHPDATDLRMLRDRLASLTEDPTPRPESGWEALQERLPDPRRSVRRGVERWVQRPALVAAAAVLLTAGIVFAAEPFGPGARSIMRSVAEFIATGVASLLDVPTPPSAQEVLLPGAEDLHLSWVPDVEDEGEDELTCFIASQPTHGIAEVHSDCMGGSYVPHPDFYGPDGFTYRVRDEEGLYATAFVNVSLVGINDPPRAGHDGAVTDEDIPITIHPLANDEDVDGDSPPPTARALSGSNPGLGTLIVQSVFGANGSATSGQEGTLTYTPEPDFAGVDSFKYVAWDGSNGFDTGSVSVTVRPVNDAPIADDVSAQGDEDEPFDLAPSVSDVEDDPLTCSIVTPPAHGKATLNPHCSGGSFTPDPDFSGPDSFTYVVSDRIDTSSPATVALTVGPVNDAPIAEGDAGTTEEGQPIPISVLANDADVDGDSLFIDSFVSGTHGTVTSDAAGTLTYSPNPGYIGLDVFTYSVSDGNGGSATTHVTVTVTPALPPETVGEEEEPPP